MPISVSNFGCFTGYLEPAFVGESNYSCSQLFDFQERCTDGNSVSKMNLHTLSQVKRPLVFSRRGW